MDMNQNGLKSDVKTILDNLESQESPKAVANGESDGDDESRALLHSQQGGLPNKSEKPKRKVQWLDKHGEKLAQILEFEPSDVSDSDEDESDSCICTIIDKGKVLSQSQSLQSHVLCICLVVSREDGEESLNCIHAAMESAWLFSCKYFILS